MSAALEQYITQIGDVVTVRRGIDKMAFFTVGHPALTRPMDGNQLALEMRSGLMPTLPRITMNCDESLFTRLYQKWSMKKFYQVARIVIRSYRIVEYKKALKVIHSRPETFPNLIAVFMLHSGQSDPCSMINPPSSLDSMTLQLSLFESPISIMKHITNAGPFLRYKQFMPRLAEQLVRNYLGRRSLFFGIYYLWIGQHPDQNTRVKSGWFQLLPPDIARLIASYLYKETSFNAGRSRTRALPVLDTTPTRQLLALCISRLDTFLGARRVYLTTKSVSSDAHRRRKSRNVDADTRKHTLETLDTDAQLAKELFDRLNMKVTLPSLPSLESRPTKRRKK